MSNSTNKTASVPRSQLRQLQSKRLVDLVHYVYTRVPLYRAKMDAIHLKPNDIKSIDDISKLPFTEKNDLRDAYPFGMFAVDKSQIVRIHASSGTTGKLTVVGYTKTDLDIWSEVMARSLSMAGCTQNSTVHIAYGYGLFTGGLGAHYGAEKIGAAVVPASSGNTARQIALIKDFGANILCCTPSYATYIADEITRLNLNISDFNLKSGIFGAEPWTNEMREYIQAKLNIKAYDIYGLSEIIGPGVASECICQDGMHVFEDHFYPEVLDEQLQHCKDGQQGELVFTTLTKQGLPLIRYRTRDICKLDTKICACGSTFVRMSKVLGRTDDMLIIRGVNVFPSQIESVLLQMGNAQPHYQLIVSRHNNADILEIKVEINAEQFTDQVKTLENYRLELENNLHSVLGLNAKIKLVEPNSLPRSEGKAKRVIDQRNN